MNPLEIAIQVAHRLDKYSHEALCMRMLQSQSDWLCGADDADCIESMVERYEGLARLVRDEHMPLSNHGYLTPGEALGPSHLGQLQLYQRAVHNADLRGRFVLDAGCGRGAGCEWLLDNCGPRTVVGIDLVLTHVRRARRRSRPGLRFVHGDASTAAAVPEGVDVVLSVEASHALRAPVLEWATVLPRGGLIIICDACTAATFDRLHRQVPQHVQRLEFEDLTDGVRRSMRHLTAHVESMADAVPRFLLSSRLRMRLHQYTSGRLRYYRAVYLVR